MKLDVRHLVTGRRLLVTVLAGGVIAAGGTATAFAASGDDDRAEQAAEVKAVQTAKISASDAAGIALRTVPGHVASVDFDDDQGKAAWEVEVIGKDGTTRELSVDTANGKVLSNVADDQGDDDGTDTDGTDDPDGNDD
ncbi:PepSY domain-containing protein [Actinomadura rudentiformis]|uniref:PepSY domain-containing protein n=1 Tax=Actinomadura rudentiformis TaxID=359158 RepID=A0A6H9Z3K5_9ACTN|nr:PepSY domain-containing protein [Actinomadura rudentiformis]KAB2347930.1 PepSY domain-containing protein [Actinomadura rudentiformis]